MMALRKLIREPLLHFLLLGGVIFGAYGLRSRHRMEPPGQIVVTQGTIDNLVTGFTRTWQRQPTEHEFDGLVRDYIREEAAYHEAVSLGLDRDDMVVRRRLQQKLEFVTEDLATQIEPSDAELQEFMLAHVESFRSEPRFSFRQIYFNPQLHGGSARTNALRVLDGLRGAGASRKTASLGDPFLLEQSFDNVPLSDIKKTFGDRFASALPDLQAGMWQGPIESGYGTHLVYLAQRSASRLPALAEVREQVRREWLNAKRREAKDDFYRVLLAKYSLRIEPPPQKNLAEVH